MSVCGFNPCPCRCSFNSCLSVSVCVAVTLFSSIKLSIWEKIHPRALWNGRGFLQRDGFTSPCCCPIFVSWFRAGWVGLQQPCPSFCLHVCTLWATHFCPLVSDWCVHASATFRESSNMSKSPPPLLLLPLVTQLWFGVGCACVRWCGCVSKSTWLITPCSNDRCMMSVLRLNDMDLSAGVSATWAD